MVRAWKRPAERLPEPHRLTPDADLGRNLEATCLDADQQFALAIRSLPNSDLEANQFFRPSGVAPRATRIHSSRGSIRVLRWTPSDQM
jgi:hypothetical protein